MDGRLHRFALRSTLMVARGRNLNVRMTNEELAMLRDVAERNGFSLSDAIRQLVRRAYAEPAPARPKKKPKR
jgi:hypothetical protein